MFVCDNLCFRSELLVTRKHTRFGQDRFAEAIYKAVQQLPQFQEAETARIRRFQYIDLDERDAESLMLRAYERGLVSPRLLPVLIHEWRNPSFEEFRSKSLWSLENCFTGVLSEIARSNPQRFCALTMALQALLAEAAGPQAPPLAVPA